MMQGSHKAKLATALIIMMIVLLLMLMTMMMMMVMVIVTVIEIICGILQIGNIQKLKLLFVCLKSS